MESIITSATLGKYHGENDVGVRGTVVVTATAALMRIAGTISGLPPNTNGWFRIHSGDSCADTSAVGDQWVLPSDQWFDASTNDPWTTAAYASDADGTATLNIVMTTAKLGLDPRESASHTVVVHEGTNKTVCGVLNGTANSSDSVPDLVNDDDNFDGFGCRSDSCSGHGLVIQGECVQGTGPFVCRCFRWWAGPVCNHTLEEWKEIESVDKLMRGSQSWCRRNLFALILMFFVLCVLLWLCYRETTKRNNLAQIEEGKVRAAEVREKGGKFDPYFYSTA